LFCPLPPTIWEVRWPKDDLSQDFGDGKPVYARHVAFWFKAWDSKDQQQTFTLREISVFAPPVLKRR